MSQTIGTVWHQEDHCEDVNAEKRNDEKDRTAKGLTTSPKPVVRICSISP